jgi:hypothetical protein
MKLILAFTRDLNVCIEGTPDADGLFQKIRPLQDNFRMYIRFTATDFRPYPKNSPKNSEDFPPPPFLSNEEETYQIQTSEDTIYVDEVMRLASE